MPVEVKDPINNPFLLRDGGYLRLKQILHPDGPLPISRSSWLEGVRTGRYPQPVKLGPRITAWRCEDIRYIIQRGVTA